ncbi:hypothetical protein KSD_74410 [Ktedonobacter sp. SOSP1-85]|uniref:cytochrome P450 n=1 Tax=Ktedonobacter sp. SOSP1-85 TaxID=2778367 RepID=UPI001915857A|nr:cytochrome P450 [Ktedonobacter sp. SOSP1-85]GHO79670.1 hypothetical protein KSD_74410 [Ktedonobacter sp. SOSP1-85]
MLRLTIPSFTLKQRLRSFLAFARDPLVYFQQLVASSPDQEIHAFPLLYKRCYLLSHPDDVRAFFKRADLFQKKSIDFAIFRQTLGNGIFVSEGELWQQQRALMNPMFTRKQVLAFVPAIASAAERMGRQWETLPAIDAWQSNKAFALRVMGEVLVRNHPQMEAVGVHFEAIERYIVELFQTPLPIPKWAPLPQNR